MTSLGRIIFFDHPGSGLSDPVTPGALPTLEQWADSITAVFDDLGSREAVILCAFQRVCDRGAVRGDTSVPHDRAGRAGKLRGPNDRRTRPAKPTLSRQRMWGTGEVEHFLNPDMPWNEEIRAAWARHERLAASPGRWT